MKRNRLLHNQTDSDPMGTVANLFDVAMVFAVALMVALVSRFNMTEMFSKEDFTMVKNPGKENMEIITKEGQEIKRYTPSEKQETSGKRGKKVGVAYQLESGEIIMDGTFRAEVPAIGKKDVEFRIYYISPLGSFATWKSTKQTGSYDMQTFEIHARPTQKVEGLRPGMSVLLTIDD